MECCSTSSFSVKSVRVVLKIKLLEQKLWSVAPNQAFRPNTVSEVGVSAGSVIKKSKNIAPVSTKSPSTAKHN